MVAGKKYKYCSKCGRTTEQTYSGDWRKATYECPCGAYTTQDLHGSVIRTPKLYESARDAGEHWSAWNEGPE